MRKWFNSMGKSARDTALELFTMTGLVAIGYYSVMALYAVGKWIEQIIHAKPQPAVQNQYAWVIYHRIFLGIDAITICACAAGILLVISLRMVAIIRKLGEDGKQNRLGIKTKGSN